MWIKEKFLFRFLDFSEGGRRYIARLATPKIIGGKKKRNLQRIAANNVGPTTPYPNGQDFLDNSHIRKFYSRVERTNVAAPKETTYIHVYVKYIFLIKIYWKKRFSKKKTEKKRKRQKRKKIKRK